ncbi:hypothetical protein TNCT_411511 [Trichonephila clavata]|uniref:Uncharacterized protein n=1 Tax=Trichonephila clavata TaxID=2740835 RepID=A0A8X6LP16_TRICU|nr:hypothetical protein TNCT_411511 [Trichonephila clavata]
MTRLLEIGGTYIVTGRIKRLSEQTEADVANLPRDKGDFVPLFFAMPNIFNHFGAGTPNKTNLPQRDLAIVGMPPPLKNSFLFTTRKE